MQSITKGFGAGSGYCKSPTLDVVIWSFSGANNKIGAEPIGSKYLAMILPMTDNMMLGSELGDRETKSVAEYWPVC